MRLFNAIFTLVLIAAQAFTAFLFLVFIVAVFKSIF